MDIIGESRSRLANLQRREFRDHTLKGSAPLHIPVVEIYKPMQAEVS